MIFEDRAYIYIRIKRVSFWHTKLNGIPTGITAENVYLGAR
jgi:hypothetical protein